LLRRGVHPEGISLDPEIFGIEGHPEGDTGGEVKAGLEISNLANAMKTNHLI
jgi:hypothetical protein